jgi:hypothetical protein
VPINKRLYEEMQAKREAAERDADRERRRALIRSGLACLVWALLGLLCYGFALHTTDPDIGQIFVWLSYLVTYGGVSFTLLRAYRKGEQRGDW